MSKEVKAPLPRDFPSAGGADPSQSGLKAPLPFKLGLRCGVLCDASVAGRI